MVIILFIIAVSASGIAVYEHIMRKRFFRMTDMMLEQILERKEITVSPFDEGELSAVAGKIRRIREKSEHDILRAEKEREEINRLISDMSHQLKTPLSSVIMYSDLLQEETDEKNIKRFVGRMKIQLDKLDWILQSMFKMVGLEQNAIHFEPEYITVRDTLVSAINSTYDKLEKKEIKVNLIPFEDRKLLHNRKWTAEVFVNILENAVKYSAQGSIIDIEVRPFEMYTEIRFSDNGIGIRKEELTRIFGRFYRSRDAENIEGSGIGLYLSRLILEQQKGYMTVSSEYGKGSCFSVFLQNCQY